MKKVEQLAVRVSHRSNMKRGPHARMEYPDNDNAFFLCQKVNDMALIRKGAQSPRKIITGFADFWRSRQFPGRQLQTVNIGCGLLSAPGFDCVAVNGC